MSIRWGIIGSGAIAEEFAKAFNFVNNGEIVAIYGRNSETSKTLSEQYNIPYIFETLDEMLAFEDLDILYIATPHQSHKDFAIKGMKAGFHILCEKPMAINVKEVEEMIAVAKETDRFLMEGLWTLYLPIIQHVKQWVDMDMIGDITGIQADFSFKAPFDPQNRLYNPDLAGGSLLDIGIYPLAFANYITHSIPEEIKAVATKTETGVDGTTSMILKYPKGITATLSSSIEFESESRAIIYGTLGRIEIPKFWMAKNTQRYTDTSIHREFVNEEGIGYHYEIEAVNNYILNGFKESSLAPLQFSLNLVRLMDEIREQINLKYPFE